MRRLTRTEATAILNRCNAYEADYHRLGSRDVERLLEVANRHGYRKPAQANGSRARCFHAYLMRVAGPRGARAI